MLVRVVLVVALVAAVHAFEILDPILDPTPTIVPWRVRVARPGPNYPRSKFVPKNARGYPLRYRHRHKKRRQRSIGNGQVPGKATLAAGIRHERQEKCVQGTTQLFRGIRIQEQKQEKRIRRRPKGRRGEQVTHFHGTGQGCASRMGRRQGRTTQSVHHVQSRHHTAGNPIRFLLFAQVRVHNKHLFGQGLAYLRLASAV